jgi:aminopeptidase YwaD
MSLLSADSWRNMKSVCLFLIWLLVLSPIWGQLNQTLSEDKRILETLCSEAFSGRGYVNGGDSLAAEFLASEFKSLGLRPIKKSFFQEFTFQVNRFPGKVAVRLNDKYLRPGTDFLVNPASGSGTFSGNGIRLTAGDLASGKLDKLKDEFLSGRCIPVLDAENETDKNELSKLSATAKYLADYFPVVLLKEGKLSWHVSSHQTKFPFLEMRRDVYEDGQLHVEIDAELVKHTARNVIAELPAKGKAKRTIVFTAHYDHLGRMGKDTYFPGANDNASGTTMLLSLARDLVGKNRSTRYIFIAFAGEEVAVLGSKHFVEKPLFPLKSITFLINMDILGGAQKFITAVNGTIHTEKFDQLVAINEAGQFVPEVKPRGPTANSDHHWFHEKGVPCFYIYTAGNNAHYHVPEDHAADVDLEGFGALRTLIRRFAEEL